MTRLDTWRVLHLLYQDNTHGRIRTRLRVIRSHACFLYTTRAMSSAGLEPTLRASEARVRSSTLRRQIGPCRGRFTFVPGVRLQPLAVGPHHFRRLIVSRP